MIHLLSFYPFFLIFLMVFFKFWYALKDDYQRVCVAMACTVFSVYCLCTQSISSVMHTIVISPSIPLERMHYLLAFEPSLSSFYTWLSTPTCLWSCIMRIAPSNHVLVTTMAPSVHSTRYFIHSYHGCLRPVLYYNIRTALCTLVTPLCRCTRLV